MKNSFRFYGTIYAALLLLGSCKPLHRIRAGTPEELQAYFRYDGQSSRIISGHRGTHIPGYPENAIGSLKYVLQHTPAFFEIDPRLTRDSVIVLLHDATLDRTTTGTGKLSDYTWKEVRKLRLKGPDGKVTHHRIPKLDQVIRWARGKTILNLDKKDVPPEMTAALIRKLGAATHVMITVHNGEQARYWYDAVPGIMLSAHVLSEQAFREYEASGVPWKQMIAYIGPAFKEENRILLELLHQRGVLCMISSAPTDDKLPDREARARAYREIFAQGADILESDYPVEVAEAIRQ